MNIWHIIIYIHYIYTYTLYIYIIYIYIYIIYIYIIYIYIYTCGGFLKWIYPQIIRFSRIFHERNIQLVGIPHLWKPPYAFAHFPALMIWFALIDRTMLVRGIYCHLVYLKGKLEQPNLQGLFRQSRHIDISHNVNPGLITLRDCWIRTLEVANHYYRG